VQPAATAANGQSVEILFDRLSREYRIRMSIVQARSQATHRGIDGDVGAGRERVAYSACVANRAIECRRFETKREYLRHELSVWALTVDCANNKEKRTIKRSDTVQSQKYGRIILDNQPSYAKLSYDNRQTRTSTLGDRS
jgi:hypothetical protein